MNSFASAIRRHRHLAALFVLSCLVLISGVHPARANGVNMAISNGQIVYGSVSGSGTDNYTFTVPISSGRYFISMWEYAGHSTTDWAARTGAGGGCDNYDYWFDAGIFASGPYTVNIVKCNLTAPTAAYALQVISLPGTPGQPTGYAGGAMQPSTTYSGTGNLGEMNVWSFQGVTGQVATVALAKTSGGAGYCPLYRVVYADGSASGTIATCTTASNGFYPLTGTNYIVVENAYVNTPDTGGYTLNVSGAGIAGPTQGKGNGANCDACEAARKSAAAGGQPGPQSGEVVSNGGAATP
jgi:hypothetical protein